MVENGRHPVTMERVGHGVPLTVAVRAAELDMQGAYLDGSDADEDALHPQPATSASQRMEELRARLRACGRFAAG